VLNFKAILNPWKFGNRPRNACPPVDLLPVKLPDDIVTATLAQVLQGSQNDQLGYVHHVYTLIG
jgi:hypothetical protein